MAGKKAATLGRSVLMAIMLGSILVAGGCKVALPKQAGECDWMTTPAATTGHTVILVDVSNSTRSSGGEGAAPDYVTALRSQIHSAVVRRDTISVAPFSGTVSDLSWTANELSADYKNHNDNPDLQTSRSTDAEDCIQKRLTSAAQTAPAASGSDPLAALRAAAGLLRANQHGSMNLVIATDGLVTTGCADLTRAGFREKSEIDAIVTQCIKTGEIAQNEFAGIKLDVIGLGHAAANQPVPTAAQDAWLSQLWQTLCGEAAGATGGCTLDPTSVGSHGSQAPPVVAKNDPVVPFTNGKQVTFSVPAAALFDTGLSAVRTVAQQLLLDIAVQARSTPHTLVDVRGYADPRGTADDNLVLSKARAEAVMAILIANGVTHVVAHGLGETTLCPEADAIGADARLQCERRVDIVLTTA